MHRAKLTIQIHKLNNLLEQSRYHTRVSHSLVKLEHFPIGSHLNAELRIRAIQEFFSQFEFIVVLGIGDLLDAAESKVRLSRCLDILSVLEEIERSGGKIWPNLVNLKWPFDKTVYMNWLMQEHVPTLPTVVCSREEFMNEKEKTIDRVYDRM